MLELAQKNGADNDYTKAILADALQSEGRQNEAEELRNNAIRSGSKEPTFYTAQAKAFLNQGKPSEALAVLDQAAENGAVDEYTRSLRKKIEHTLATQD